MFVCRNTRIDVFFALGISPTDVFARTDKNQRYAAQNGSGFPAKTHNAQETNRHPARRARRKRTSSLLLPDRNRNFEQEHE
jgi:hypothetical protein